MAISNCHSFECNSSNGYYITYVPVVPINTIRFTNCVYMLVPIKHHSPRYGDIISIWTTCITFKRMTVSYSHGYSWLIDWHCTPQTCCSHKYNFISIDGKELVMGCFKRIVWKGLEVLLELSEALDKIDKKWQVLIVISPSLYHYRLQTQYVSKSLSFKSNRTDGLIVHKSNYIYYETGNEVWPQKPIMM